MFVGVSSTPSISKAAFDHSLSHHPLNRPFYSTLPPPSTSTNFSRLLPTDAVDQSQRKSIQPHIHSYTTHELRWHAHTHRTTSPLEMMYHPPVEQDAFKTMPHPVHLPNPVYRKHPSKPTLQPHLPILSITIRDLLMSDHPTRKDSAQTMVPM